MPREWLIEDAGQRIDELVERAQREGPQVIKRNGTPVAVVTACEEEQKPPKPKVGLLELFRNSPLRGVDLDLKR